MGWIFAILFFFVSFLLIALILLQEGKGGGIAAMGGAQMDGVMGVKNPLRRWTAYFFIAFVVLVLGINTWLVHSNRAIIPPGVQEEEEDAPATPETDTPAAPPVLPDAETSELGAPPADAADMDATEGEAALNGQDAAEDAPMAPPPPPATDGESTETPEN